MQFPVLYAGLALDLVFVCPCILDFGIVVNWEMVWLQVQSTANCFGKKPLLPSNSLDVPRHGFKGTST